MNIFKNAACISCEDDNRVFHTLIADKGIIVHTGDDIPEIYARSPVENLDGKCVVPAFVDTHIHFESFAFFHSSLDCRTASDLDELAEMIQTHIQAHSDVDLILGFGCSAHSLREKRIPVRADLDIMTTYPLMIIKYDGHAAVANSALINRLPVAVLNETGFDPKTGWFFQQSFYSAVNHITKSVSLFTVLNNMIAGSDYLARKGIGLVHTAEGVGFPLDLDVDIMRLASLGLPQQYRTYFQTMDVQKAIRRKMPRIGGCFATALDGCFGSEDAALSLPYSNNSNNRGILFYTQPQVNAFVQNANRSGLQVSMHAIGDAAVEQALNAYENALKDFPRNDHRHTLIHADLMTPALIEKAASLGIAVALQTPFLFWEQEPVAYLETILGNRIESLIPLKSMLNAGLLLGNGSDGPCTLPDPIFGIHAACNHPNPDERISALDALKMHTHWGAKLSFDEKQRGTLTEGKTADFVILDQNPLTVPIEKIKEIQIEALYLKGVKYTGRDQGSVGLLTACFRNKLKSIAGRFYREKELLSKGTRSP
jgi:predicted amidohydrolase YtcJ